MDNGQLWFSNLRVPRDALLDKYGSVDHDGTYRCIQETNGEEACGPSGVAPPYYVEGRTRVRVVHAVLGKEGCAATTAVLQGGRLPSSHTCTLQVERPPLGPRPFAHLHTSPCPSP